MTTTAARRPATPSSPPADLEADDVLRQTQTVRAIASAKSLDDISDDAAETLFGDAAFDLVSAALASAEEWPDEEPAPAPPPAPAARAQPEATKAAAPPEPAKSAAPAEDPFDWLGLGEDAPLELIDDATLPPVNPARRTAIR
jgi:hypothetical protein